MKVLIADNERYCRDSLHDLVEQNQDIQVSGIAVDADGSPECVVVRELRRILDGCPICEGVFRDHMYSMLATVVMNKKADGVGRLAQFLQCIRDCRWQGIVTVFSPADSEAPDQPLHFTILSVEEGKKLLAVVEPGHWMHLRPALHPGMIVNKFLNSRDIQVPDKPRLRLRRVASARNLSRTIS